MKIEVNLLLLISIFFVTIYVSPASTQKPPNDLKTLCKNTTYPQLCVQYLSLFPKSTLQDPMMVVRAASLASLARAQQAKKFMSKAPKEIESIDDSVLRTCVEVLGNTVDQLRQVISEIDSLKKQDENCDRSCHLDNLETWMGAAETNAMTCGVSFDDFPGKKYNKFMTTVKAKALNVEQAIDNAYSLFCPFTSCWY